jgi:diguanylate cyclase (GGDEF)-like protein/PAS domain S-box-containing protein
MENENLSREELILKIEALENLIREYKRKEEEELTLEYSWTGNLGQWYWDCKNNIVVFNPLKVTTLGYKVDEIPEQVTYQFFTDKLHPDDYHHVMEAMKKHLSGEAVVYETEYRIRTKDGGWRWYLDMGKITQRDPDGSPTYLAGIVFDTTERHLLLQQIEEKNILLNEMAISDSLTKLFNHQAIHKKLEEEMKRAKRYETRLSILLIDIDFFKKVNDSFGHQAGDLLLVEIANILKTLVREVDIIGRVGGEEFLVIFPNNNVIKGHNAAERIRKKIEKMEFSNDIKVTISGGVAEFEGESIVDLVDKADKQLYRAKNAGRNRIMSNLL